MKYFPIFSLCTTDSGQTVYFNDYIKDVATVKDIKAQWFVGHGKLLKYGLKLVYICTPKMIDLFEDRKEKMKTNDWTLPECLTKNLQVALEVTDEVCRMIHQGKTVRKMLEKVHQSPNDIQTTREKIYGPLYKF